MQLSVSELREKIVKTVLKHRWYGQGGESREQFLSRMEACRDKNHCSKASRCTVTGSTETEHSLHALNAMAIDQPVTAPAIIFRRKRSGRLLPWNFDVEIERPDLVSEPAWDLVFGGMTEAIIIDSAGQRWRCADPKVVGIQTKDARDQSIVAQVVLTVLSLLVLNPSLLVRFGSVVQDRVTPEDFQRFVLDLLDHQKPGFTRAPEEDVRARLLKRKTLRGMINAVVRP